MVVGVKVWTRMFVLDAGCSKPGIKYPPNTQTHRWVPVGVGVGVAGVGVNGVGVGVQAQALAETLLPQFAFSGQPLGVWSSE